MLSIFFLILWYPAFGYLAYRGLPESWLPARLRGGSC